MRPLPSGQAGLQAAELTPALIELLRRLPRQEDAGVAATSNRHMATMADRANNTQLRGQLLRSYLTTV